MGGPGEGGGEGGGIPVLGELFGKKLAEALNPEPPPAAPAPSVEAWLAAQRAVRGRRFVCPRLNAEISEKECFARQTRPPKMNKNREGPVLAWRTPLDRICCPGYDAKGRPKKTRCPKGLKVRTKMKHRRKHTP